MTHLTRPTPANFRHLVSVLAFGLGLGVPALAAAQTPTLPPTPPPAPQPSPPAAPPPNANCPPGSWFCGDTQQQPAAPAGQPVPGQPGAPPLQPLPPPGPGQGVAPPPLPGAPPARSPAPPVVIYQPPPPVMIVRPEAPPPYYYAPRPKPFPRSQWGLNLHLEGAAIGGGSSHDTSMGGGGFGLRYRMVPHFAIETDLDFIGGRDYNGFRRDETALTFNGLVFLNPKSHAQVYLLGGFGWAGASVTGDNALVNSTGSATNANYAYFGGQLGVGLELRMGNHFALNGDFRGFIRGRIDNSTATAEFYDGAGRSTNTSGGVLFTGGATFYF